MPGYQPRVGDPVWWNGANVNDFDAGTCLGNKIDAIHGWDDRVDVRDVREPRHGQDGEHADNVFLGGRTITFEGTLYGSSWADLQARKRALMATYVPRSAESLLKIPDPTAAAFENVWSEGVEALEPTAWWRFDDLANPPVSNNYDAAVLARGDTVALWDSSGANLVSGGAHAGTVNGNPVVVDGPLIGAEANGALDLDGTGDYIAVTGYSAALNPSEFTASAWIYRDADTGANEFILSTRPSAARGFALRINGSDKLGLYLGDGVGGSELAVSTSSVPVGRWVHVAGTFDGSAAAVYLDGVREASVAEVFAPNLTGALGIAYDPATGSGVQTFNGKIARPALHNAALTAEEIGSLFVKGRPVSDTQGNHALGMIGTPTSATGLITGDTNACFDFPGTTNTYLQRPYTAALNAATFSLTGKIVRDTDTGAIETIVSSRSANASGYGFRINASDKLEMVLCDGTASTVAGTTSLVAGTEYSVAATFDGTTVRLYVDGTLDGSGADAMIANTTAPFRVGIAHDGTLPFNGKIDELTYHGSTVLTDAQIAELYDRGLYDHETYADTGMYSYERTSARVIESVIYGDLHGPAAQSYQVVVRASDPRIYSDILTTIESGSTGTAARTATVDQSGTYETPVELVVTGPTAATWSVSEPTSGLTIGAGDMQLLADETVTLDIADRTATLLGTYDGIRIKRSDVLSVWMLDETSGTTADNAEGTAAYDGTYTGGLTLNMAGPKAGVSAVKFNGSTGYITVPFAAALNPTEFTFECWVKLDSTAVDHTIIETYDAGRGWSLAFEAASGRLFLTYVRDSDAAAVFTTASAAGALVAGTWYHIVVTFAPGASGAVYVDANRVMSPAPYTLRASTSGALDIARGNFSVASYAYLDGSLAACAMYSTAMTAVQIADLYEATEPTSTANAYSYLDATTMRFANLGTDESTFTLASDGLDAGSKLAVSYRDARL